MIHQYDRAETSAPASEVHWLEFEDEVTDAGAYVYEVCFEPADRPHATTRYAADAPS
jgi:hypothetical protein